MARVDLRAGGESHDILPFLNDVHRADDDAAAFGAADFDLHLSTLRSFEAIGRRARRLMQRRLAGAERCFVLRYGSIGDTHRSDERFDLLPRDAAKAEDGWFARGEIKHSGFNADFAGPAVEDHIRRVA